MSRQSSVRSSLGLRNRTLPPFFQFCAGQLAIAGLLALSLPKPPAAVALTEFDVCTAELRYADISATRAANACSEAINPKELSECVLRINVVTPTIANDALVSCQRVRRPVDLAKCVVEINKRTQSREVPSVISYCRRSLLPVRFSECVVGLTRQVDVAVPNALATCIDAEDFESELVPRFAPAPPPNPTAPPNVPETSAPTSPVVPEDTPINPVTP